MDIQKFNIILESGLLYQKVMVLSSRGMARDSRDVRSAVKYENGITIVGKGVLNKFISAKDFYEVEEVVSYKEIYFNVEEDTVETDEIEVDDLLDSK